MKVAISGHKSEVTGQDNAIKRTYKVLVNSNEGKYPEHFSSDLEKLWSAISYYTRYWWYGDFEAIQYTGKVDLDFYCKMYNWDAKTATALSLGQSPTKIARLPHRYPKEFMYEYNKRISFLQQAIEHKFIPTSSISAGRWFSKYSKSVIKPLHFLEWVIKEGWDLYFDMEESIRKYHVDEDIDFQVKCKELEIENRKLKWQLKASSSTHDVDEFIHPRRLTSYKQLIAGLLRLAFQNKNEINAFSIAGKLSRFNWSCGMPGEETIRDLISEPREMLGIRKQAIKNKSCN